MFGLLWLGLACGAYLGWDSENAQFALPEMVESAWLHSGLQGFSERLHIH